MPCYCVSFPASARRGRQHGAAPPRIVFLILIFPFLFSFPFPFSFSLSLFSFSFCLFFRSRFHCCFPFRFQFRFHFFSLPFSSSFSFSFSYSFHVRSLLSYRIWHHHNFFFKSCKCCRSYNGLYRRNQILSMSSDQDPAIDCRPMGSYIVVGIFRLLEILSPY